MPVEQGAWLVDGDPVARITAGDLAADLVDRLAQATDGRSNGPGDQARLR